MFFAEAFVATKIFAAVGPPLTRHGIKVKGRRDYDRDLGRLLERALAEAISPDSAGTRHVAETARVLAKRFSPRLLPGYPKGWLGERVARLRGRPLSGMGYGLDPGTAHPDGALEDLRIWARNSLDRDKTVADQLTGLRRGGNLPVTVADVVERFPDAFVHALYHDPLSPTARDLLKGYRQDLQLRGELTHRPRPDLLVGGPTLTGGGAYLGAEQAGLTSQTSALVTVAAFLLAVAVVVVSARFPRRRETMVAVRLAAVRTAAALYDAFGPAGQPETTADMVEAALKEALARPGGNPGHTPPASHRAGPLGEHVSQRLIPRAQAAGDTRVVAALFRVEDVILRVGVWPEAQVARPALFQALYDLVRTCAPPPPAAALTSEAREVLHIMALLASIQRTRPALAPPGDEAATPVERAQTPTAALPTVRLVTTLTNPGRSPRPRIRRVRPPRQLRDGNWVAHNLFPGACLHRLNTVPAPDHDRWVLASLGEQGPPSLEIELRERGAGTVTVTGIGTGGLADLDPEALAIELIASVQILLLHSGDGKVGLTAVLSDESGRSFRADLTDVSHKASKVESKAARMMATCQTLLATLLSDAGTGWPGLVDGGRVDPTKWSQDRVEQVRAWTHAQKVYWAETPAAQGPVTVSA